MGMANEIILVRASGLAHLRQCNRRMRTAQRLLTGIRVFFSWAVSE
jgi:hypothetical protein